MNSIILAAGARLLVALLLVFSVFMLLRGHDLPGGGFIGGLLGALSFIVLALASGPDVARRALFFRPQAIAVSGLGIALCAGLAAGLLGEPLFTGQWLFIGATESDKGVPLSTVLVFDIGVYLAVLGAILTIAFALEEAI